MQIGISTASFYLRLNNEDALPLLNEWGVPVSEVFLSSFSEYSSSFAKQLAAGKGNVRVHSVHVINTQFEPQLYAAHPRVKADAYYWLGRVMRAARVLGAHHYTFHGIARLKRTFRENAEETARLTREIGEFCAKYGVKLCYENVEWAFFNRPSLFSALKAGDPSLMGVLDIKQARLSGYDYRAYIKAMEGNISHVHVSDVGEDGGTCLPGTGTFDFSELFSRLRDVGFDGPVLIENYTRDFRELCELKHAYEYLSELAEK